MTTTPPLRLVAVTITIPRPFAPPPAQPGAAASRVNARAPSSDAAAGTRATWATRNARAAPHPRRAAPAPRSAPRAATPSPSPDPIAAAGATARGAARALAARSLHRARERGVIFVDGDAARREGWHPHADKHIVVDAVVDAVAVRHGDDDAAQHAVEHADAVVDAFAVDDRRSHADQDGLADVDAVVIGGADAIADGDRSIHADGDVEPERVRVAI